MARTMVLFCNNVIFFSIHRKKILIVLHSEKELFILQKKIKINHKIYGVTFIIKSLLCTEQQTLLRHVLATSAAFTLECFSPTKQD